MLCVCAFLYCVVSCARVCLCCVLCFFFLICANIGDQRKSEVAAKFVLKGEGKSAERDSVVAFRKGDHVRRRSERQK